MYRYYWQFFGIGRSVLAGGVAPPLAFLVIFLQSFAPMNGWIVRTFPLTIEVHTHTSYCVKYNCYKIRKDALSIAQHPPYPKGATTGVSLPICVHDVCFS